MKFFYTSFLNLINQIPTHSITILQHHVGISFMKFFYTSFLNLINQIPTHGIIILQHHVGISFMKFFHLISSPVKSELSGGFCFIFLTPPLCFAANNCFTATHNMLHRRNRVISGYRVKNTICLIVREA
jgi:hypothetical protein